MFCGRLVATLFVGISDRYKSRAVNSGERRYMRSTANETTSHDAHANFFHNPIPSVSSN
jgi:hypothetical protein